MTPSLPILLALSVATGAAPASDPAYDLPPTGAARPLAAPAVRVALASEASAPCALRAPDADALPSSRCLGCHGASPAAPAPCDHPVGRRLDGPSALRRSRLRPEAEAVRRGVLLDDGRVECLSCHDGRSRWAAHVVQLPGAPADAPSLPPGRGRAGADVRRPGLARAGGPIDTTALCAACHDMESP